MRIGILTLPFNNNYGGYLQAYALMAVLKQMGHKPTVLMRRQNVAKVSFCWKLKLAIKGILKTILTFRKCQIVCDVEYPFRHRGAEMLKFVDVHIAPQTPYIYDTNSLREYCEGRYDAYIVGSDQVWRAIYVPDIRNYFLDFTTGWRVKRVAYAASFGTDTPEYTDEQICQCGKLLKSFDAVSVRENSGKGVIDRFGWSAQNLQSVLDPTMLLTAADYSKVLPKTPCGSLHKIFYYVLDETEGVENFLGELASFLRLGLCGISNIQKGNGVLASIEDWLTNIRDAEFVVTDSFHGMVFSIIFHKPFVVCVNSNRGADRFSSLLTELNLSDRIMESCSDMKKLASGDINWFEVDNRLGELRDHSFNFLKQAMQDNE